MRSIARRRLALAAAASLTAAAPAPAAPGLVVHEPLLGLRWQVPAVRFEPVDPRLTTRCPGLVNANYDSRLWVLARSRSSRGELLVVSGRAIPRRPGLAAEPDDAGAVVRLTPAGGCDMIGPAADPFDDPEGYAPQIGAADLAALAGDAARRYVAAYRSAPALCAAAARQHIRTTKVPAMLRHAFEQAAPCLRQRG